jgi:hypothetical protein
MSILKNKGVKTPEPRQQLLDDLTTIIQLYNRNNDSTIVMMDANESLYHNNSKLPNFLAATNLTPLIENPHHYPATHKRGQQWIDFIFGSPNIQNNIIASGITAFYEHPWPLTDHRGLFLDVDILGLFGASLHTPLSVTPKRLSSLSRPMIKNFINKLEQSQLLPNLLLQLHELNSTNIWTDQHHLTLENIDTQFTDILLSAEEESALPTQYPWSPTLDKASLLYTYWIIVINGTTSRIDTATQLDNIKQKLEDTDIYQNNPNRRSIAQMRIARRNLINCQLESQQHRDIHLNIQHEILVEKGQMSHARAIRIKINREHQRKCWKLMRNMIHGQKTAGGISHILIPTTSNDPEILELPPQRIQTTNELNPILLTRNIDHVSQAHGTPFTLQPILQLFGSDGCTNEALAALDGDIPTNISRHSKILLQHMQRVRDPIPLDMSFEDMCKGFSKWKESTTTSPSNKHLGIYKSLLNARKYDIRTETETNNNITYNNNINRYQHTVPIAEITLQIQYYIMMLAVNHCHTYKRWQVVHNFLLEKTSGQPLLNKLQVIHIYEADWSLIQRFYVAHKLTSIATKEKTTTTEKAGGRPGRSSIELAINRVITYETIQLQCISGAVMYNDAKACYDRIVECISNLALLREGLLIE